MSEQESLNKKKGIADLVFLIDATGSMGGCIDAVKRSVEAFITELEGDLQNPIADWRARVVGFRDAACDGSDWYEDYPFVRTAGDLISQVTDRKFLFPDLARIC